MPVLIDTSVWIAYFKSGSHSATIDYLIDENLIVTNDLILAELVPSLRLRNQSELIDLLNLITRLELSIDWHQLVEFQYNCLKAGMNGIGIPDLIIAQNALQHHCEIFSLDHHFHLIKDVLDLRLTEP